MHACTLVPIPACTHHAAYLVCVARRELEHRSTERGDFAALGGLQHSNDLHRGAASTHSGLPQECTERFY